MWMNDWEKEASKYWTWDYLRPQIKRNFSLLSLQKTVIA